MVGKIMDKAQHFLLGLLRKIEPRFNAHSLGARLIFFLTEVLDKDLPCRNLLRFYRLGQNRSVLLLGDSVTIRTSNKDNTKLGIDKLLEQRLEKHGIKLNSIAYSAYNTGIYYLISEALKYARYRPEVLIMPINLRSFSIQWDFNPTFQNLRHIQSLTSYILRKNPQFDVKSLMGIDQVILHEEFVQKDITDTTDGLCFNKNDDYINIINKKCCEATDTTYRRKILFSYHYMHTVDVYNRKFAFIEKIVKNADDLGIKLIMYILPINFMSGMKYVGDDFLKVVEKNVNFIQTNMQSCGARVKDYSTLFDPAYFFHEDETTEHLNEKGRHVLAGNLYCEVLKGLGVTGRTDG